jgi:hypothetical protein
MTWLTCLTRGANEVNYQYLYELGFGTKESITTAPDAYPCDPDYGGVPMLIRKGMYLRLTRNLDKDRGFCNGASSPPSILLCCCSDLCYAMALVT